MYTYGGILYNWEITNNKSNGKDTFEMISAKLCIDSGE